MITETNGGAGGAKGWWLESGEERHAAAPATFEIPAAEDRRSLRPGDWAKCIFAGPRTPGEPSRERMWVTVASGGPEGYVGKLDNDPAFLRGIRCGDEVRFGPEHVIDIMRKEDA